MFQRFIRKFQSYFRPWLYPVFDLIPENQFQEIARHYSLSSGINRPKVSVIIPSYNNPNLLSNCLNSVIYFSLYSNIEVIVIDNDSNSATKEILKKFSSHTNFQTIYNSENKGYGPAINQGLKVATGDIFILLNNDTIVAPFWIDRLVVYFHNHIGLIGPVTNSSGNIQQIFTPKLSNLQEIINFADKNYSDNIGQIQNIDDRLAYFCVALSRQAYQEIGLFDETFERGYFEDDDYCLRAKKIGWKMKKVQDVFIYHAGRASFDKLADKEQQRIWNKNKTYFEQKWDIKWTPPK